VQDHDRGVVLGTTTYGKGLVQALRSLPHNTSLKITTAQYHTPSGRSIQNLDQSPFRDTTTARDTTMATHTTTHGRTVRDRTGLRPDVTVHTADTSALEAALKRRAAFFYYANHYAASRDTLAEDFAVTNATLDDFHSWLKSEDIQYPTAAEHALRRLRKQFGEEMYGEVKEEVAVLREAVRAEKRDAFRTHAEDLKRHLEREILARFVTKSEQTAALLPHDRQVGVAVDLVHDETRYEGILAPKEE
jgi:carboxyl-terminal processing protease